MAAAVKSLIGFEGEKKKEKFLTRSKLRVLLPTFKLGNGSIPDLQIDQ